MVGLDVAVIGQARWGPDGHVKAGLGLDWQEGQGKVIIAPQWFAGARNGRYGEAWLGEELQASIGTEMQEWMRPVGMAWERHETERCGAV
jgi:hypothetical protein